MRRLSGALRRLRLSPSAGQQSVRRKLMAVNVRTTAIALLLAAVAMSLVDMTAYRNARASQLSTEASILALAAAPALAFDDHTAAQRILGALRAHSAVLAAALYTADGSLFASYGRAGQPAPPATLSSTNASVRQSSDEVRVTQRVTQNEESLGTIYLRARFDMLPRILTYCVIILLVTALGGIASLILSTPLQRAISSPLDSMTRVAGRVVDEHDYSQRAAKTANDEIGLVIDAFNRMLDEVQLRTRALEASDAALREADRRKDEFLATLAHELRNPLAPIRNAAEFLRLHKPDDRQREWARDVIMRQVKRMALLLDDLLDVSRITRQRLVLKKENVSLTAVVSTAIETARPLIDAKQHSLQVSLPPEPIELDADPLRLSQALSNLLHNAAKYTDPHGLIRLSADATAEELRIEVSDSGIGIDPKALPAIFEMFAQIDSPIDRAEGGLGIGLSLVRGLVALHGGTVDAVSAGPGQGSTFTIRLPGPRIRALECQNNEGLTVVPAADGPVCRIVVADDNVDAAESLALVIRMWNHEVCVARTGSAALEIALRDRPDVCILDIGMPGMTGYEVAQRIRSQPWGSGTMLLALTGWGQSGDVERAKAAGFDEHMTKPVDLARLAELLANYRAQDNSPARASGH
jgi:signal transduction histidine kinase/ActR/RegA family two-component response regulator